MSSCYDRMDKRSKIDSRANLVKLNVCSCQNVASLISFLTIFQLYQDDETLCAMETRSLLVRFPTPVGQGPIALAVGAGGELFGHFYSPLSFLSSFSPLSLSLWETVGWLVVLGLTAL